MQYIHKEYVVEVVCSLSQNKVKEKFEFFTSADVSVLI